MIETDIMTNLEELEEKCESMSIKEERSNGTAEVPKIQNIQKQNEDDFSEMALDPTSECPSCYVSIDGPSDSLTCKCLTPSGKLGQVTITPHNKPPGTYKISMNAYEPGLHKLVVENNGTPVPGSPFNVRIMQALNVHNVRAWGPGLQSGVIESFRGMFSVSTCGGGPGSLCVRVQGPRGACRVGLERDGGQGRVIEVSYDVGEGCGAVGVYEVQVVWSGRHVRGSPFRLFLGLHQEQVKRWHKKQLR